MHHRGRGRRGRGWTLSFRQNEASCITGLWTTRWRSWAIGLASFSRWSGICKDHWWGGWQVLMYCTAIVVIRIFFESMWFCNMIKERCYGCYCLRQIFILHMYRLVIYKSCVQNDRRKKFFRFGAFSLQRESQKTCISAGIIWFVLQIGILWNSSKHANSCEIWEAFKGLSFPILANFDNQVFLPHCQCDLASTPHCLHHF